jgi:hypothetical protein
LPELISRRAELISPPDRDIHQIIDSMDFFVGFRSQAIVASPPIVSAVAGQGGG